MSPQPLWLRDLAAYSMQVAALLGVGAALAKALRLRVPSVRLAYWQALLAWCLLLPLLQPWQPEVLQPSRPMVSGGAVAAAVRSAGSTGLSFAEVVLFLLLGGIAVRLVWNTLGLARLQSYRRQAQRLEQTPQAVVEAQRLVSVVPQMFISRRLVTPATFGLLRPVILFPAHFLTMDAPLQKAVALHELLHVKRRDWLWNLFEELVLTLLWFHLPLWWVVRSIRLSREQAVDAEAVCRSKARRPYLQALLEIAGQKSLAKSLPAPLFLRESELAERVTLLLKEAHMSQTRLTLSILTSTAVLLIAGASVVWTFPLYTPAQQAEAPHRAAAAFGARGPASPMAGKAAEVPPKLDSAIARSPQENPSPPATADRSGQVPIINKEELRRQVKQALKDAKVAQQAAAKINHAEIQRQIRQTMEQGKVAQQIAEKINKAEIQRQIQQAMEQAKIARQIEDKTVKAEIERQVQKAMEQAQKAHEKAQRQLKELKPPAPPTPPSPKAATPPSAPRMPHQP